MKNNILFIGAGRLGTTLAWALSQKGFSIPVFYSKEFPKNKADYLPDTNFINQLNKENLQNCDILIITVPDAQIIKVVNYLESLGVNWQSKLVVHTSGCLSSSELHSLKLKGAEIGSIHPMQTFDSFFIPKEIFRDVVFAVEGDDQVNTFTGSIIKMLNAKLIQLNSEDKILYHIAAVASSNFIVVLLDYVNHLYKKLEFDDKKINELVLPIINQSLINFKQKESKDVLTGPIKRGDLGTIEKHVKYLKDNQKELLPIYKEMSKYILQFLLNQNEPEKDKLNKILND